MAKTSLSRLFIVMRTMLRWLVAVNGAVAVAVFFALALVVALQVFTRFVLLAPLIWSEEVARFLFFWAVLLGAAISVRKRRHFVIDVFPNRGKQNRLGGMQIVSNTLPDVFVFGFSFLLLVQGLDYVDIGKFSIGTNSRIQMSRVYAAIPVFAALSIIYSIANIVDDVQLARAGKEPPFKHPLAD